MRYRQLRYRTDFEEGGMMERGLALVTGGAVRVGRAISIALADAGYRVVVHANSHFEDAQNSTFI